MTKSIDEILAGINNNGGRRVAPPTTNHRRRKAQSGALSPKNYGLEMLMGRAIAQAEKYVTEEYARRKAKGRFSIKLTETDADHEYNKCIELLLKHGFSDVSNLRTVKHDWPKSYLLPAQDTVCDIDIDGIPINVRLYSGDSPSSDSGTKSLWRTLELVVPIAYQDRLIALLEREVLYRTEDNVGLKVYIFDGKRRNWYRAIQSPRLLETVVLPIDQKNRIVDDIDNFLSNKERYAAIGIPWHRGYLFHGEPGTGKSALAKAIASHWEMELYVLNLGELGGDYDLTSALVEIPPRSVLLLEDVDVFSQTRRDKDEKGSATFAGLLNALDGVFTPHGLIKIMTSNSDVATFDEALIRDGRIDLIEHVGHADAEQVTAIVNFFYDDDIETIDLGGAKISPAKIVGAIKNNTTDIKAAVAAIEQMGDEVSPEIS